jgi:hypothetical protein
MRAALLFVATLATVISSVATVRADDKQVCTDAYSAAQPLRRDHKLLAARTQLRLCVRQECSPLLKGQIVTDCTEWLTDVEAKLPSVVFSAKDGSGADITNATVSMDGAVIAKALDGQAIDIDPGQHTFKFVVPGQPPVEVKVVATVGSKNRLVTATIGAPPASPVDRTPAAPPASYTWIGWVATGALAVGGAVTGALAIVASNDLKSATYFGKAAPDGVTSLQTKTQTMAIVSDVLVGAAAAAFGVTLVVVLTKRSPSVEAKPSAGAVLRPAPEGVRVGVSPNGVFVGGSF